MAPRTRRSQARAESVCRAGAAKTLQSAVESSRDAGVAPPAKSAERGQSWRRRRSAPRRRRSGFMPPREHRPPRSTRAPLLITLEQITPHAESRRPRTCGFSYGPSRFYLPPTYHLRIRRAENASGGRGRSRQGPSRPEIYRGLEGFRRARREARPLAPRTRRSQARAESACRAGAAKTLQSAVEFSRGGPGARGGDAGSNPGGSGHPVAPRHNAAPDTGRGNRASPASTPAPAARTSPRSARPPRPR